MRDLMTSLKLDRWFRFALSLFSVFFSMMTNSIQSRETKHLMRVIPLLINETYIAVNTKKVRIRIRILTFRENYLAHTFRYSRNVFDLYRVYISSITLFHRNAFHIYNTIHTIHSLLKSHQAILYSFVQRIISRSILIAQ